jgi:hypothetical protein
MNVLAALVTLMLLFQSTLAIAAVTDYNPFMYASKPLPMQMDKAASSRTEQLPLPTSRTTSPPSSPIR